MSPFATCSLNGGGSDSCRRLLGLMVLSFWYSCSGMQLTKAPESMRASMEKCWKSIGANSMRLFCLRAIAENIGRHRSPVGLFVEVMLTSWSSSSCISGLLLSCWVSTGLGFGCGFWLNSHVSARLISLVFGAVLALVVFAGLSEGSPSLCVVVVPVVEFVGWTELSFIGNSGLWGDDGDDVIAARISFVCAGTLVGDPYSVELVICGLRIGLREIVGGVTITCISSFCSSACCTGEWLRLPSSFRFVVSRFMFVFLANAWKGTLIVSLKVRVVWSYRSGLW